MKGKGDKKHPRVSIPWRRSPAGPAGVIYVGYPSLRASRNTFLLCVNGFPIPMYPHRLEYWAERSYFPLSAWRFICKTLNHR